MSNNNSRKTQYDYNIYKIPIDKVDEFISFLEKRFFSEFHLKQEKIKKACGFSFRLLFCDKDNKNGISWINILSDCSEEELDGNSKIYGAVLICTSKKSCYVISYGNAHFYFTSYCDYDFGMNIAERLLDLSNVKAQQNISQGGKKNKTMVDYLGNANLSYYGSEIPTYVRGKSIDENIWGNNINCGITSVQFKWIMRPLEIGSQLHKIDGILKKPAHTSFPRLLVVDKTANKDKIESLNNELVEAIIQFDDTKQGLINIPSFYFSGTTLIQNNIVGGSISCQHKRYPFEGELSLHVLQDFLKEKEFDLQETIGSIHVSLRLANEQYIPSKPIISYLEFVTGENFCLRMGKWWKFNKNYLDVMRRDVNKVQRCNHIHDNLSQYSPVQLKKYAREKGILKKRGKLEYETYYNMKVSDIIGAELIHPKTTSVGENNDYKYEICDLVVNDELYFVKIGEPSNFTGAIDQAQLTLSKIQSDNNTVRLPSEKVILPKAFHLLLVFKKRKTIVEEWQDIGSLNFYLHLIGLHQELNNTDIKLNVDFVYNTDILKI